MNSVYLLTKLQIQEMLGNLKIALKKRSATKLTLIGSIVVGLVIFIALAWIGYTAAGYLAPFGLESVFFNTLFLCCGTLTMVFSIPLIMATFFSSSDINDLLPLPVSPLAIAISKSLSALSSSYFCTLLLIAGPFLGWGIASGAGPVYWLAYVLAVLFTPLMPVAYAGTISIIIAALFKRVRSKDVITTLATVFTLAVSFATVFIFQNLQNTEIVGLLSNMSGVVSGAVMAIPAYGFSEYALVNSDLLSCLLFVVISLVAFVVFVAITRLLYLRIVTALTSSAGKKVAYDGSSSVAETPVFRSLVRTEVHKIVRNSSIFLNYVCYPILFIPIFFISVSSSGLITNLQETFIDESGAIWLSSIILSLFLFLAFAGIISNKIAGTCISREGSNWSQMKVIPIPMVTQIRAKILPSYALNVILSIVFMIGAAYYLVVVLKLSVLFAVYGLVIMLAASWLVSCVGAWSDSRNPNVEWGNDADANVKTLRRQGGMLRALLVGLVYTPLPVLTTALAGGSTQVVMPIITLVSAALAVVLGNTFLKRSARNIETFE